MYSKIKENKVAKTPDCRIVWVNQAWNIDIWFIVTEATKGRISDELFESNFRIMPKEQLSEN